MKKVLGWFMVCIFLGGIAYLFWHSGRWFSFSFPPAIEIVSREGATATSTSSQGSGPATKESRGLIREILPRAALIREQVAREAEGVKDLGVAAAEEGSRGIVDQAKKKTLLLIENTFSGVATAAKKLLGNEEVVAPIVSSSESAQYVRYLLKNDESASFLVRNPDLSASLAYRIEWGDGGSEEGEIKPGQATAFSHIWVKAGEYAVIFRVAPPGVSRTNYSMRIAVEE